MFVLKESKDRRKAWVFWSEHSRKSGIYFAFCVTEHLRRMVCSVLEINICSQDLQEIIIYKTINKNFTAINKGYFKSDCNPFKKQPPEVFYKKTVLKSFTIFSGKQLCWSLFLIKLKVFRSATSLKRDSNTGGFLWILRNFQEHLFRRTSERCSDIKRNYWNVLLSIFMFSCANLYYKYAQSNSYEVLNFKSVKITDMKSTRLWISYHF